MIVDESAAVQSLNKGKKRKARDTAAGGSDAKPKKSREEKEKRGGPRKERWRCCICGGPGGSGSHCELIASMVTRLL